MAKMPGHQKKMVIELLPFDWWLTLNGGTCQIRHFWHRLSCLC